MKMAPPTHLNEDYNDGGDGDYQRRSHSGAGGGKGGGQRMATHSGDALRSVMRQKLFSPGSGGGGSKTTRTAEMRF
jgi:hypothetical protein